GGEYQETNSLLQRGRLRLKIYDFLKNPVKNFIETPEKVLFFSIPVGLLFFVLSTYNYYSLEFDRIVYMIDDYLIFTAFIVLLPYSIFAEAHFRRIRQISLNFPEFLNRLVSLHDSGMTIAASIKRLGSSNLGILTSEVNKMDIDIELKGSISEAFRNFGRRINTLSVQRVVVLVDNAIKMTGNIKDTLVIAANDATAAKAMDEDRKMSTQMHIIIIYIAFFVFLYVIWALVTSFLPEIPNVTPETAAAAQIAGEGITFSGIDKLLYTRLFFHASVLEGFFSGLVAGQMGDSDARLGLKHSLAMTAIAYIMFMSIS
ncbi:MAG: type II secretion system F family protein, partial [Candidatus Methanoperedens sp.]